MACGAQLRLLNVVAFGRLIPARRCPHNPVLPVLNFVRAIYFAFAFAARRIYDKSANPAVAGSQLVFTDLMTNRARDAVSGQLVHPAVGARRDVGEDLALVSLEFGLVTSHRHV